MHRDPIHFHHRQRTDGQTDGHWHRSISARCILKYVLKYVLTLTPSLTLTPTPFLTLILTLSLTLNPKLQAASPHFTICLSAQQAGTLHCWVYERSLILNRPSTMAHSINLFPTTPQSKASYFKEYSILYAVQKLLYVHNQNHYDDHDLKTQLNLRGKHRTQASDTSNHGGKKTL